MTINTDGKLTVHKPFWNNTIFAKMYKAIVLFACLLAVKAAVPPHSWYHGVSPYYRSVIPVDEAPKPYQFAYQAEAIGGASARQESADGSGTVVGSYSLSDADGRSRVVDYVADGAGFRASVKTNEPGTKSESPADVPTVSSAGDASVVNVAPAAYGAGLHHYGTHHRGYGYPYGHAGHYGYRGLYGGYGGLGHYGGYGGLGHYGAYGRGLGYYGAYGRGLGYYGAYGKGLGYYGHPHGHNYYGRHW